MIQCFRIARIIATLCIASQKHAETTFTRVVVSLFNRNNNPHGTKRAERENPLSVINSQFSAEWTLSCCCRAPGQWLFSGLRLDFASVFFFFFLSQKLTYFRLHSNLSWNTPRMSARLQPRAASRAEPTLDLPQPRPPGAHAGTGHTHRYHVV